MMPISPTAESDLLTVLHCSSVRGRLLSVVEWSGDTEKCKNHKEVTSPREREDLGGTSEVLSTSLILLGKKQGHTAHCGCSQPPLQAMRAPAMTTPT